MTENNENDKTIYKKIPPDVKKEAYSLVIFRFSYNFSYLKF